MTMDVSALVSPVDAALGGARPGRGGGMRIGATDAARAAVIAALVRDATGPSLVVVPKSARAGDLIEELQAWLGPQEAGRLRVYPQRDILPYERAADDPWDAKARLEVTAALASGERPVVVAAIEAVAQRTLSPEAARAAFSSVSVGDRLTPDALVRRLVSAGFAVVSLVEAPGQVARRGGIIDVYAPQDAHPARIEFFGPEVESIRRFEVVTQRSTERVQTLELGVAAEFSPDVALAAELMRTLDFSALDEEHD